MARLPSLNHQMHERMEGLKAIGESKHQAKQEYKQICENRGEQWNPTKTVGIHSYNTYEAYKQTSKEFIGYMREHHKDIKDINQITKEHTAKYLNHREQLGCSPYTISKDLSALNKLLNQELNKKDLGLHERSYKTVIRSRGEKSHDSKYNPANYKDQITFARATGCRRESVLKIEPNDFRRNSKGQVVAVELKEKGGRIREATVLKEYRDELTKMVENKAFNEPLFDRYTTKIDNHAFRSEYAVARYSELVEQKGHDAKDYRGYDKEVIAQVSQDLGHNRLGVVVEHYLR